MVVQPPPEWAEESTETAVQLRHASRLNALPLLYPEYVSSFTVGDEYQPGEVYIRYTRTDPFAHPITVVAARAMEQWVAARGGGFPEMVGLIIRQLQITCARSHRERCSTKWICRYAGLHVWGLLQHECRRDMTPAAHRWVNLWRELGHRTTQSERFTTLARSVLREEWKYNRQALYCLKRLFVHSQLLLEFEWPHWVRLADRITQPQREASWVTEPCPKEVSLWLRELFLESPPPYIGPPRRSWRELRALF